jgi:hypothetical protein
MADEEVSMFKKVKNFFSTEEFTKLNTPRFSVLEESIMAVERSKNVQALVEDAGFIKRLQPLLTKIAFQVYHETPGTVPRKAFAQKIMSSPQTYAVKVASYLMNTDNFVNSVITIVPMGSGFAVETDTTDAAAESQIFSKFDEMATLFGV